MPAMAPIVLGGPAARVTGDALTVSVEVAAVPDPSYQWLENGTPIPGATQPTLIRRGATRAEASRYSVRVTNTSGSATSERAVLR
jgi:hypothetical protein